LCAAGGSGLARIHSLANRHGLDMASDALGNMATIGPLLPTPFPMLLLTTSTSAIAALVRPTTMPSTIMAVTAASPSAA